MKKIILIIFAGIGINVGSQTAMEAWQGLLDKKELAEYFKGSFESLGIIIDKTNERFTVYHKSDHFELLSGVDSLKVDYLIHLKPENIQNMRKHGEDDVIDEQESYQIMSVIFTPLTQSGLSHPMMTKKMLLRAGDIEEHLHVHLHSPDNKSATSHTIVFVNGQWLLIPGIHGKAQRKFDMMPKDAVEYQKQLFAAQKANTNQSWKKFSKWYKTWKKTVSVEI